MNLQQFQKKFVAFKQFETKIPGVALGLNVLQQLNLLIKLTPNIVDLDQKDLVEFYDFEDDLIKKLSFDDLNFKLNSLYTYIVFFNRNIHISKLYSILCSNFQKIYQKNNYVYSHNYNMYTMINKFIHGLRLNFSKNLSLKKIDCYYFDLHKIITNFDQNYFDQNVSPEQFYVFWVDFIISLSAEKAIILDEEKRFFSFNIEYKQDLMNIMFYSFDLMLLGVSNNKNNQIYDLSSDNVEDNLNKIYHDYDIRTIESQFHINDLLVSLVLSSCVSQVCAPKKINNIFIEAFNS